MGIEIKVDNLEDMCGLMCDNRLPQEKTQTIRQNINWLLEQYIKTLDDLEADLREEVAISAVRKSGQASIYRKVIKDLQETLEEGEDE